MTLLKIMIRKPRLRLSMQMVLRILPMSANSLTARWYTSVLIMYLMVRVKHLGNQTARTTSLLMYMERLSLPENLLFLTLLINTLSCVLHGYLVLMERTLLRLCLMLERLMTRFVLSTTRLVHQLTH